MRLDHLLSKETSANERLRCNILVSRLVVEVVTLFNLEGTRPKADEAWRFGGLAQLGERLPCKQEVSGSIPLISTTKKRLTEIPKEFEVSLSLLKKKLKHAP